MQIKLDKQHIIEEAFYDDFKVGLGFDGNGPSIGTRLGQGVRSGVTKGYSNAKENITKTPSAFMNGLQGNKLKGTRTEKVGEAIGSGLAKGVGTTTVKLGQLANKAGSFINKNFKMPGTSGTRN